MCTHLVISYIRYTLYKYIASTVFMEELIDDVENMLKPFYDYYPVVAEEIQASGSPMSQFRNVSQDMI